MFCFLVGTIFVPCGPQVICCYGPPDVKEIPKSSVPEDIKFEFYIFDPKDGTLCKKHDPQDFPGPGFLVGTIFAPCGPQVIGCYGPADVRESSNSSWKGALQGIEFTDEDLEHMMKKSAVKEMYSSQAKAREISKLKAVRSKINRRNRQRDNELLAHSAAMNITYLPGTRKSRKNIAKGGVLGDKNGDLVTISHIRGLPKRK
ncbi:unnamed protein product [Urochloa humidicola]